jgi:hypothetical protein
VVVVGLTVVVGAVVVVGLTVVVGAVVVVGLTVVVVAPVVVVGLTVVVVGLTVVVVVVPPVPPELVADASCPTLTPASAIMATTTSQPAVRLRAFFFTCLAIDPYLLLCATTFWSPPLPGQTRQPLAPASSGLERRNNTGPGVRGLAVAAADQWA